MTSRVLTIVIFIVMCGRVAAQGDLIVSRSSVEVTGTSTLHDWEMKSEIVTGNGSFIMKDEALTDVKDLRITVQAERLKSGKEGLDKTAYKTLKTDRNKTINFQSTRVVEITQSGSNYAVRLEGKLSIAGVTKTVTVKAICSVKAGSVMHCKGEHSVKMTDASITLSVEKLAGRPQRRIDRDSQAVLI